ncbi:hypothetical protein Dimus_005656 [Dionaea muscipula]
MVVPRVLRFLAGLSARRAWVGICCVRVPRWKKMKRKSEDSSERDREMKMRVTYEDELEEQEGPPKLGDE